MTSWAQKKIALGLFSSVQKQIKTVDREIDACIESKDKDALYHWFEVREHILYGCLVHMRTITGLEFYTLSSVMNYFNVIEEEEEE